MITGRSGISLIELLCAVCLITGIVVVVSVAFPKFSKNVMNNQPRWMATHVAASQIASIMGQPYDTIDVTSFPSSNANCDCTTLDFSVLPKTSTRVGQTVLNQASCVDYVAAPNWQPQCTSSIYKHLLVRVWWTVGNSTATVSQDTLLTRF